MCIGRSRSTPVNIQKETKKIQGRIEDVMSKVMKYVSESDKLFIIESV